LIEYKVIGMGQIRKSLFLGLIGCFLFAFFPAFGQGQKDIVGVWNTTENDAKVEIFREGNHYHGKIVWLAEPTENGKAKVDNKNSDRSKRGRPILGMRLLNDFEYKDGVWEDGTIYDPTNGKTYSATLTKKDENTLEVRGFVGFSFIGRKVEWTKAE
jgi:uncharacterized protein (DUF2147 family)